MRAAALYGANASGKSNLVKAISAAYALVVFGTQSGADLPYRPFRLAADALGRPTRFQFDFVIDRICYSYVLIVTAEAVVGEALYRTLPLTPAEVAEEAAELRAQLFDDAGVVTLGPPMHRSVPHSIATGDADVGLFFLHLAVTAMRENPGVFEAVYLAVDHTGVTDDPDVLAGGQAPLPGNGVGTFAVSRTSVPATAAQVTAREDLIAALQSPAFTQILAESGLRRP